jgi:hypothetical protein
MYDRGTIKTEANIYHRKARFDELGYPSKLGAGLSAQKGELPLHRLRDHLISHGMPQKYSCGMPQKYSW